MRISDWSSDVCSSDLQMRPLQAKMRIGLVGHADPAVNLDIGAAIVERRLVGAPFRGGDMERRTGIARIERAGGIIELRPRDGAAKRHVGDTTIARPETTARQAELSPPR